MSLESIEHRLSMHLQQRAEKRERERERERERKKEKDREEQVSQGDNSMVRTWENQRQVYQCF